jgi:predicted RNase H-like HicB family nuclease
MATPFIVTNMGHRFKFTPEDVGYSVSELGVKGVNTQGDTFEEALANALEASRVMAEFREELLAEAAAMPKEKRRRISRRPALAASSAL